VPSRADSKKAVALLAEGLARYRDGDALRAAKLLRSVIQLEPANPTALALLGAMAMQNGDLARAASLLERAARFATPNAALFTNLGEAYRRLGRREEAVAAFRRAIAEAPTLAEAHYNLGLTLDQLGQRPEAIASLERALSLNPGLPQGVTLLLEMLRDQAEYYRAIAAYHKFGPLLPASASLEAAVANVLADVFRLDEALAHFRRALELEPSSANLHADYATALVERGEVPDAIRYLRSALELDPHHVLAHGSLVYLLAFDESADAPTIGAEARRFGVQQTTSLTRASTHPNTKEPERRLRVAYISPDFRLHPSALFTPPLLREHDRSAVEVFCYSNARRTDAITAQIRALADEWRDISTLTDDAVASLVQADRIDVLVDLSMHCAHNRLLVFARKPAPVQVCWLAYPGTTGLSAMDYRITDPRLDPDGRDEPHYSEQSCRLPETFWCYAPLAAEPAVNALPAAKNGHVTFGSLNSFKKVSRAAVDQWARVLVAVPGSRMVLVAPDGQARERVLEGFRKGGVQPERIELMSYVQRDPYLEMYHKIDCCLDTLPYCGGTTSLDAFWMGVPVVTLAGRTVVGRSGVSLAHNLDLPELVARTPEEYVGRAVALCSDWERLAELRAGLRERMQKSPLMDAPRFARNLEAAYRQMWARWCREA